MPETDHQSTLSFRCAKTHYQHRELSSCPKPEVKPLSCTLIFLLSSVSQFLNYNGGAEPKAQRRIRAAEGGANNKIHPKRASRFRRAIFWL